MKDQGMIVRWACGVMLAGCLSASSAAQAEIIQAVVRLQPKISMQDLANAVSDPKSVRYQVFFTPQEIRDLSAPSDSQYENIIAALKQSDMEIISESPTHLAITVRGERKVLEQFHANAKMQAKGIFSSIAGVHGLTSSGKRHHHLKVLDRATAPAFTGLTPAQIRTAYGFDAIYAAGITGKGQHIAIATYDGFYVQDTTDYYAKNKISPAPSVDEVVFNGQPTYQAGSAAETQTDVEFSGAIAPGASIHVFASSDNSDAGELAMYTAILDDNRAKIVNYSWGMCEPSVSADHKTAMDALFARAIAQGVNIFVASGDSGSDCNSDGSVVADWPASNPNVVAVGGTNLTIGANGVGSETAWSGSGYAGGSGGGISSYYDKPTYQAGLSATVYAKRSYPDVSFNADPKSGQPTWIHYDPNSGDGSAANASYVVIGGTSIAAPQWAGFLALVNEARGAGHTIAALSPILYGLNAADQGRLLNDITSGNNGAYSAGPGWDAVTGLGSMKASDLITVLKSN